MLFNSPEFAIFFVVVTFLYFVLPHKARWFLLLAASCYFYMTFVPVYIFILAFTIIVDYCAGILIENSTGRRRKTWFVVSLVANIGILVVFKYFNFFGHNLNVLAHYFKYKNPIPPLNIILPIGLSFHTFQAMSYTIEVYRGNQRAERHLGIYSLYVMFYPQLVAGPIERPQNLLHQFKEKHRFKYENITKGLRLMAWGLFKKVVIADRIAVIVNDVYADPHHYNAISLLFAVVLFSFQIYCDFSGYSDIAIGAARAMGFHLMKNFDNPFQSRSVAEFWRRWHISLSSWLNDYLYLPLSISFRDQGKLGVVAALLFTFFLAGLWHGANWTFVIYGLANGAALVYEFYTRKIRKKILHKLPAIPVMLITQVLTWFFVACTWIFFRSPNTHTGFYICKRIFTELPQALLQLLHPRSCFREFSISGIDIAYFLILMCGLTIFQWLQSSIGLIDRFNKSPFWLRWSAYFIVIYMILVLGVFNNTRFIYFQF